MSKQEILEAVNKLVVKISELSRRFFYSKRTERISEFFIIGGRGANVIFLDLSPTGISNP